MVSKKIAKLLLSLVAFVGLSAGLVGNAAALDASTILSVKSKAALEGVYQCFEAQTAYYGTWQASKGGIAFLHNTISGEAVKLPYGLTDASDNNTDCKQIMKGFYDNSRDDDKLNQGLIPKNIQSTKDVAAVVDFFAGPKGDGVDGIGWKAEGSGNVDSGQETEQLTFTVDMSSTVCTDNDGHRVSADIKLYDYYNGGSVIGTYSQLVFPRVTKDNNGHWFWGDTASDSAGINVPAPGSGDIYEYEVCGAYFNIMDEGDSSNVFYEVHGWGYSMSYEYIISASGGGYGNAPTLRFGHSYEIPYDFNTGMGGYYTEDPVSLKGSIATGTVASSDVATFDDYTMVWLENWMKPVIGLNNKNQIGYKVNGLITYGGLALTEQEAYDLYKYYITDVFKVPIICEGETNYELYGDAPTIKWQKGKTCRADTGYRQISHPSNVYGVDYDSNSDTYFHFVKSVSLDDVIATMNLLSLDKIDGADEGGNIESNNSDSVVVDPENTSTEVTCTNSGAAESLGWIVCPIMSWARKTMEDLYDKAVVPALQVEPELFDVIQGDNNDVRDAWGVFQNIANTVFVIVLLVVIFSQLTGVGIDNYGIKKVLPKLIVAAVLVNLSYYICVICVDLSNIAGNAVQSLFDNMGSNLDVSESLRASTGQSIATTGLTGVVIAGVLAIGIGSIVASHGAVLLPVLLGVISGLIAVLFLFLILAARQAAVIILTVVSPLAFVCYMLPNTKKIFDRWLKMGWGLLLVYPICGLLVGGGNYVSKLLLTVGAGQGGLFMAFAAMAVGIVPIFFIPTVLKSSFAAMGNLGAKISSFGSNLGKRASGRVGNSSLYKDLQQRGQESSNRFKAGIDKSGKAKDLGRVRTLMRGGKKGVAAARSQYLKDQDTRQRAERLAGVGGAGFAAAQISQEKAADRDQIGDYMTLINENTRNGDNEEALNDEFEKYMSQGEAGKFGAIAAARIAGRRKDTAARFAEGQLKSGKLSQYDPVVARAVAKEIATGENSSVFKGSTPLQFQYASDIHSGKIGSEVKYSDWVKSTSNVDGAMGAFVTKSDELIGVKGSGLREIADLMETGGMSGTESTRLQTLAQDTINNRSRIAGWDSTKAAEIGRIAGWTYHEDGTFTDASGNIVGGGDSTEMAVPHGDNGAPAPAPTPAPGPAPASGSNSPTIMTATGHESIDELRRMAGQGRPTQNS